MPGVERCLHYVMEDLKAVVLLLRTRHLRGGTYEVGKQLSCRKDTVRSKAKRYSHKGACWLELGPVTVLACKFVALNEGLILNGVIFFEVLYFLNKPG